MDDQEAGAVDSARLDVADGDDIEVLADPAPRPRARSRAVFVGATAVVVLAAVAVVALASHHDPTKPRVLTAAPQPGAPGFAKPQPNPTVPHKKAQPKIAVTTVPASLPPATSASASTAVSLAPPPTAPAPTTVAAPKQYGPTVLTWVAPSTFSLASGATKVLAVTARNGSDGTVTLPHPLSCTPRLDHSEICAEVVQVIVAGDSATVEYTIDARDISPGRYTLNVEGVLTIPVTVTAAK